jgi:hypothetical protein
VTLEIDKLTPEQLRQYAEDYPVATKGPYCHIEITDRIAHYTCTRRQSHAGPHVAHGLMGQAVAVWKNEDERGL